MKKRVKAEDFVRIWQEAPTATAAAEKLGCSVNCARARAQRYRKLGIPLKRFAGGTRVKLDHEALKALAEQVH